MEGPDEVTFPVDPATWEVGVPSGPDRLEATEGPLSVLPSARQWTEVARDATNRLGTSSPVGRSSATLIGYSDVDLTSRASVQEFVDARQAMPEDVQLIKRRGSTTVLAEAPPGMGRVTAADIVAGVRLGGAGGIRALDIGYGGEDGRPSFWAETRDEFGQLSDGPLPDSTLITASELHDPLAEHRVRHTTVVAPGQAYTWPAGIGGVSE